ncbi:hypothetical protein [Streptomyces silvisoli]
MALSHNPSPEVAAELAKVSPRLEQADAFVVVTPLRDARAKHPYGS